MPRDTRLGRKDGTQKEHNNNVKNQSDMEHAFGTYCKDIVSEWNPCYDHDGNERFKWDEDIGAHNVEVDVAESGSVAAAEAPVSMCCDDEGIAPVPAASCNSSVASIRMSSDSSAAAAAGAFCVPELCASGSVSFSKSGSEIDRRNMPGRSE